MTHALDRSLSSLTALAAASLLLSTSPAMAQGQAAQAQPPDVTAAAPAATAPAPQAATTPQPEVPAPPPAPAAPPVPAPPPTTDTAPAAMPAPAVPAPAPQAPTMTSNPVVQTVPDSTPAQAQSAADAADSAAAAPARQAAPRAHAAARPAEPAQRAQTETRTTAQSVAKAPAKPADTGTTDSGLTRRDPVGLHTADGAAVAPAAAPAPSNATNSSDMERYWPVGVAGGVLLIGLAGYALTRRRREDEDDEVEVVVTPTERTYVDPSYVEAVAAQPVAEPARAVPVPVDAVAEADARTLAARTPALDPAAEAFAKPISRRKRADSPEGVMLREGPLPTGEERAELLQRMMEAEPDEANPFHTPRARMRRARLILQAREKELREKATERFDWRTYKPSMKPGLAATQPTADAAGKGGAQKADPVK
ncbi:hypothetical protein [Novosphingobium rosa]|uniref:hypothetical protein n=1 Tax=Novosphingobium rosa TaxID=76978 RepID=UPI0008343BAA|nr:hypothetical protein [Novosphingobium rosa]